MKRRNLIPIALILLLVVSAGCEAAPKSTEARPEEPKQPAVITASEETTLPAAEKPEPREEEPKPETTEPAPQIPEEETPFAEKKGAQPYVENPPKPDTPVPKLEETSKERETVPNPTSPPQTPANTSQPTPAPVEAHQHSYGPVQVR